MTINELVTFLRKSKLDNESQMEILNEILNCPILVCRNGTVFMQPQILNDK